MTPLPIERPLDVPTGELPVTPRDEAVVAQPLPRGLDVLPDFHLREDLRGGQPEPDRLLRAMRAVERTRRVLRLRCDRLRELVGGHGD